MSISPKLSNSLPREGSDARWRRRHERTRHKPEVIRQLASRYEYQFKFVIDTPVDCGEVEAYLAKFPLIDHARVLLMPQGTTAAELAERDKWLVPYAQANGWGHSPRRHIEWFGLTRGT
jgi:7-carboxy-7-deazaguanine synthase